MSPAEWRTTFDPLGRAAELAKACPEIAQSQSTSVLRDRRQSPVGGHPAASSLPSPESAAATRQPRPLTDAHTRRGLRGRAATA